MTSIVGSFIGRLIGVSGVIPEPEGPHKVIGTTMFRFPGSVLAQVFYPGDESSTPSAMPHKYVRKEALDGLGNWTGQPASLFYNWCNTKHPFKRDIAVKSLGKKLPIFIFSHGLGGNSEIYSKVCSDIASFGYVVIACEHEDGSASFAYPEGAVEPLLYIRPNFEYTRENVLAFREPHLEIRKHEIQKVIEFLIPQQSVAVDDVALENDTGYSPSQVEGSFSKVIDSVNIDEIWLAGHSFGGATVVSASKDDRISKLIKGTIALDIWPMPLNDHILETGLQIPFLSINTQQFYDGHEVELTRKLISNSSSATHAFYVPGTAHMQYSDMPFLTRQFLAKKIYSVGTCKKEDSQRAIIRAIVHFMESPDTSWETILKEESLVHL